MLVDVVQPNGFGLVDEQAEHAVALGQRPDLRRVASSMPRRRTRRVRASVAADPQRAVAGVDQLDRGVHDRAQRGVQVQPGCHRQHRVDQAVDAVTAFDDLLDASCTSVSSSRSRSSRQRLTQWTDAADLLVRLTVTACILAPSRPWIRTSF